MEGGGDAFGSSTAPLAWHDFLERMRQPSAAEFVKSIKSFIVTFSNRAPDPEKDSASVQEFLENMEGAFRAHTPWAGSSEEELESAGEGLEKYVMTKLYNRVFASVPEDVKSDEELFEKILSLKDPVQSSGQDTRRDSDVSMSSKPVERVQSISDLEKKGATELLNDDDLNKKFQDYPYLFARAGDLTIADVESLLNSYKQLVVRYVALAQGKGVSPETTLAQSGQTSSDLIVSEEPENVNSVANNNENGEGISKTYDDVTSGNHHSEVVDTEASEQMTYKTAADTSDDSKVSKDEALHQPENA
nr:unnamed protein product [Digitaria exilis]